MALTIGTAVLSVAGASSVVVGAGTLATATVAGISAATIVGYATIAAGLIGAEALLDATSKQTKQIFTSNQALSPRSRAYGRTMVGGIRTFMQVRNGNLYQDIALVSDEIDAIEAFYIGGVGVAVIENLVQSVPWGRGGGSSYIGFDPYLGAPGQGLSTLVTNAFPELGNFTLSGIAHVGIVMLGCKASVWGTVYPQQFGTQFQFVIRGAKVFDPRQTGQSASDKTTWTWSENAGLCILDYLTHKDGLNLPMSVIDLASFSAFADVCDQPVALKAGGTEARYRVDGTYTMDEMPKDVLDRLCAACDGQLVQSAAGLVGIRGGVWTDPTVSIGSQYIVSCDMQEGNNAMAMYNRLITSFSYGSNYYQMTEIAARDDLASQATEGQIQQTYALPFVTSYTQAARLTKIKMLKDNPLWIGTAKTLAPGLNAIGESAIDFEFTPQFSTVALLSGSCLVTAHSFASDLSTVDLGLSYLTADAYAWDPATEEPDAPRTPFQISDYNNIDAPANAHAVISGGIGVLTWDAADRVDVIATAQYQVSGSGNWQPMTVDGSGLKATTPTLTDGTAYDFEVLWAAGATSSAESVVADITAQVPPSPPTQFTASASGGTVTLRALTPQSSNFYALQFSRSHTGSSTQTLVGSAIVTPSNQYDSATDTPGSGSWTYYAVSTTSGGSVSASATPVTVTV